ncbi:MAG: hypothetical protein WKG07_16370 [Hymenobacter sp.]
MVCRAPKAINAPAFDLSKSSNFAGTWSNFYASRLDRWTPDNPNSNQPRMTADDQNGNDKFSSRYVENASYLRLRNLQLGYTLPTALLSKYQVGGVRVYVSVDNLLTFTKYTGLDPEISSAGYFGNPLAYGVDFGNYPAAAYLPSGCQREFLILRLWFLVAHLTE